MADIVHRIGIRAPAGRVLEAVESASGVASWWTRDTTGEGTSENRLTSRFVNLDGEEIGVMRYEVDPRRDAGLVCWHFTEGPAEWLGTEVTFELSETDGMTILVFGHRKWAEPVEFMAHCSMKWAVFLMSLRELLETGQGKPAPADIKIDNWN